MSGSGSIIDLIPGQVVVSVGVPCEGKRTGSEMSWKQGHKEQRGRKKEENPAFPGKAFSHGTAIIRNRGLQVKRKKLGFNTDNSCKKAKKGGVVLKDGRKMVGGLEVGLRSGLHFEKVTGLMSVINGLTGPSLSHKRHFCVAHLNAVAFFDPLFCHLAVVDFRAIG